MAIRARADNLSLDYPEDERVVAPLVDFAEVWAHREVLRQACVRLTGDAARADDLVQDTFVSALKSGDRLDRGTSIGPWLATVARRRSIDEIRGRQRVALVPVPPEPVFAYADDPADHVLNQELVAQLRAAVSTLTDRERQLLLRQATYGMSLAELAAEEQTTVASVRSVLARARHKLRMTLERNGALGVLPLPRALVSLRERFNRWAVQLETSMPTLAGASAHMSNVVVALVAAIAMMFGAGPPVGGDSVVMIGHGDETTASSGGTHTAGPSSGHVPAAEAPEQESPPNPPSSPAATANAAALGPVTLPTLPQDSNRSTSDAVFEELNASDDGRYVFATGLNHSADPTIFRSSDFGQTWTRLQAFGYQGGRVLVPPTYPTQPRLFVVAYGALWRSDDDGAYFWPVAPAAGSAVFSSRYAAGDERIFIAGSPVLEYDVESGMTSPIPGTAGLPLMRTVLLADSFVADGALLLGGTTRTSPTTQTAAVYRCTSMACGSPTVLTGMSGSPFLRRLADGTIVAWNEYTIFMSDDDGASFRRITPPIPLGFSTVSDGAPDELLLAATGRPDGSNFFRSTDSGASWTSTASTTPLRKGAFDVIRLANGSILAAPAFASGLLCSTDNGASWHPHC